MTVLRDKHDVAIRQQKDWHFFSFLRDYVELAMKTAEITDIFQPIEARKEQKLKELSQADKEAVEELMSLKEALLDEIKKKKVTCDELPDALVKLTNCENEKTSDIFYKSTRLKRRIDYVLEVLPDSEVWLKKYDTSTEKFLYRGTLNDLFNDKKKTELWGMWDKLNMLCIVLSEDGDYVKSLDEDSAEKETFDAWREEMRIIREEEYESGSPKRYSQFYTENRYRDMFANFDSDDTEDVVEFKRSEYVFYLDKIHSYIFAEIPINEGMVTKKPEMEQSTKNHSADNIIVQPSTMKITLGTMNYKKGVYGYLQFFIRSKKVPIGKCTTRQYRLIKCLFSPENKETDVVFTSTPQSIDRIYDNISLQTDGVNSRLKSSPELEKRTIIENTVKEIQKIKDLQGYIDFEWSSDKMRLQMKLHPKRGVKI